jgi:hypothetical protein
MSIVTFHVSKKNNKGLCCDVICWGGWESVFIYIQLFYGQILRLLYVIVHVNIHRPGMLDSP